MTVTNALRWSEQQLADHLRKTQAGANPGPLPAARGAVVRPAMNKTEAEYAGMLESARVRGEIVWWKYEPVTLKLADSTRYTPDFLVLLASGELEVHETKGGFIREDGWLKLKIAAAMFPFRFFLCQKMPRRDGGGWLVKRI
jgi:hypothetical protein